MGETSQTGDLKLGGHTIAMGERRRVELPVARLPTDTWLTLPLEVVRGAQPGPTVWLSAGIHGDELNGLEIVRRVLDQIEPDRLAGSLLAAPIINVFGITSGDRYLPDRRDLNRSFPGSAKGSLAARLANLFMTEIVARSDLGLDFHTGSNHRTNLPQIRANLSDPTCLRCAEAFHPPIVIDASERDGSLRQASMERGIPVLLYEGGEALRFDATPIAVGVQGTLRVLVEMGMIETPPTAVPKPAAPCVVSRTSSWVRARRSGVLRLEALLGQRVAADEVLGSIASVFGEGPKRVRAPHDGVVIGMALHPLANRGDALVHVARLDA
ncbi:Succinylglutamate desuccinylase [Pirellulimonas nuda]|uniref:Succinylglutamate desuccinylase n=1 Tax=Pirellulimonas nuda TaxID=2528009 RepID=A0A518D8P0_9BACT|nr:succinylglutamate desuccinylase/aspartoacylase family protein [Pirellulimonas nuda]QDU87842.1 Succinylglutamate desuccinylase [Pirellulimonas nuda]